MRGLGGILEATRSENYFFRMDSFTIYISFIHHTFIIFILITVESDNTQTDWDMWGKLIALTVCGKLRALSLFTARVVGKKSRSVMKTKLQFAF